MAEAKLTIGTRQFRVACEDGQESLLQSAAALMDQYARSVQTGPREMSEAQMLLMTGLLVADQAKAAEKENANLQAYQRDLETRLSKIESRAGKAEENLRKDIQSELKATKEELELLKGELAKKDEQLSQSKTELEALENANTQNTKSQSDLENEINTLKGDLKTVQGENLEFKAKAAEASRLQSQLHESQVALEELEALKVENSKFRNELSLLQTDLEKQKADQASQISALEKEKTGLEEQLSFLSAGTQAIGEVPEISEEDANILRAANAELEENMRVKDQEISDLKKKLEELGASQGSAKSSDDLLGDLIQGLERIAGE